MNTEIQWTGWPRSDGTIAPGFTFNPFSGCVQVSRACRRCYAMLAPPSMRRGAEWGATAPRVHASEAYWKEPARWNAAAAKVGERRRVFCASMADVFERHAVPEEQAKLDVARERLWRLIADTPALDWLLLTKRPEEMAAWAETHPWPPNAWAGCTAEGQREYDQRIGHLLRVPAHVRFLSVEPMVGPVALGRNLTRWEDPRPWQTTYANGKARAWHGIDWVIVGGESGRGAEPLNMDHFMDLLIEARAADARIFVKQLGSAWASAVGAKHPKGGDPEEWVPGIRIREWPDEVPRG